MKSTQKSILTALYIFIFCQLYTLNVNSQETQPFNNKIDEYFKTINLYPKENIYIHFDKPYYSAGDIMFYKIYLVDNFTMLDNCKTNYVYVEVFNKQDSLVSRQKIRRDNYGIFKGSYKFPTNFKQGNYLIRAYTSWMQNWSSDYFFSKRIIVGNPIDNDLTSDLSLSKKQNGYYAQIQIYKNNRNFRKCELIVTEKENGKIKKQRTLKSDDKGNIVFPTILNPNGKNKNEISFKLQDKDYEYNDSYILPVLENDFSLSFFPEGGNIIAGNAQVIAFKAQKSDGFSTNISGIVIDSQNDTIANIKSIHDGMGYFSISSKNNEKYTAIVKDDSGLEKIFQLPEVKKNGIAITASLHNNNLLYKIIHSENTILPDTLSLLINASGNLILNKTITKGRLTGIIKKEQLPEGIIHLLIVSPNYNTPISERLVFIRRNHSFSLRSIKDTLSFSPRTKESITFSLYDGDNIITKGNYSLSITDGDVVKADSITDNIYSSFFITSQLKGYIENPGYYFGKENKTLDINTDLLMLTHGWRKYADFNFAKHDKFDPTHLIEVGQTLTGKIKDIFGKGRKGKEIIALSPKTNILATTSTIENGKFIIQGINFPDSTTFVVRAKSGNFAPKVEVIGDKYIYPNFVDNIPYKNNISINSEYLETVRDNYYDNGGMKVYNLKEVYVYGKKKENDYNSGSIYDSKATESLSGNELTKYGSKNVYDAIIKIPGIVSNGTLLKIHGKSDIKFVIDNMEIDSDESITEYLRSIPIDLISEIKLFTGADATIFNNSGAGVIVINSNTGDLSTIEQPINITIMSPMGYSKCMDFYNPVYITPEQLNSQKKDIRTTLYWNPSIKETENSIYNISFYNNDSTKHFHLELEGISKDGIPFRYTRDYK